MFSLTVKQVSDLFNANKLRDGFLYRCEFLNKPKHNTLAYARIPAGNLVLFDVMIGPETYLSPAKKIEEAWFLGLEPIPNFWHGEAALSNEWLNVLLAKESILGGCKVEGIVIKNYDKFTVDKKIMIGKFVSKEFKEKHQHQWKQSNPGAKDVVQHLVTSLKTDARWNKAIQHLRDAGQLTETPADIGKLIKEIQADIQKEEQEEIMTFLFNHFWQQVARGVVAGFPEFYKKQLGIIEATTL
jgi:hypothetical protein